jgi:predicted lipoprotein with Yx(FWY)xxD motif
MRIGVSVRCLDPWWRVQPPPWKVGCSVAPPISSKSVGHFFVVGLRVPNILCRPPGGVTMHKTRLTPLAAIVLLMMISAFAQPGMPSEAKVTDGILTDAKGMTLYTYDEDKPGAPTCDAACLGAWPPLKAPVDAKPMGGWTVVTATDGTKQWAYKGKPLYTFAPDQMPGVQSGDNLSLVWHTAKP